MAENQEFLKTFDSDDIEKVIEGFKKSGLKKIEGTINFSASGTFAILEVRSDQDIIMREYSDRKTPGIFLLLSRHDLVEFLKSTFDLRERSV